MKQLQKLPTETHITKSGKTKLCSYALFHCPSCKEAVKKEITIGMRAKSCGAVKCRTVAGFGHGMHNTQIYHTWGGMKERCRNSKHVGYKYYGEKGITYSPMWEDFKIFYLQMGSSYVEGYSLDRIDPEKNYSISNCRWISKSENTIRAHSLPIAQFNLDGTFVKSFDSVKEASLLLDYVSQTSLNRILKLDNTPYKGYLWRYLT